MEKYQEASPQGLQVRAKLSIIMAPHMAHNIPSRVKTAFNASLGRNESRCTDLYRTTEGVPTVFRKTTQKQSLGSFLSKCSHAKNQLPRMVNKNQEEDEPDDRYLALYHMLTFETKFACT